MKHAVVLWLTFFSFFTVVKAEKQKPFWPEASLNTSICGETLPNTYVAIGSAGGSFSFNVTAPPTCTYSITSNNPSWLNVTMNGKICLRLERIEKP
jgi:hypothetical protein